MPPVPLYAIYILVIGPHFFHVTSLTFGFSSNFTPWLAPALSYLRDIIVMRSVSGAVPPISSQTVSGSILAFFFLCAVVVVNDVVNMIKTYLIYSDSLLSFSPILSFDF